jgi:carboxymethylenebutenolidase
MNEENRQSNVNPTAAQEFMRELWEEHMRCEFATPNTKDTLDTMVEDAHVNHVPVMTGGVGKNELRKFYSERFIPQMPPDTEIIPVSRTIGADQLVDEMIFKFTHTVKMDWMLPGVAPTGKRVEIPLVAIIKFRGDKLAHEHIYWDQASVLAQIGLLDVRELPVAGIESAQKVLDPTSQPSNALMNRIALNPNSSSEPTASSTAFASKM